MTSSNPKVDLESTKLSAGDLQFLLATYASEESPLSEFVKCLSVWEYAREDAIFSLLEFLRLDELGIAEVKDREIHDLSEGNATNEIQALYKHTDLVSPIAFLTEKGWMRYEVEDWGISTARARFLMFSNHANQIGDIQRVRGA